MFNKYPIAELSKTYEIPQLQNEKEDRSDQERNVRDYD